MSSEKIKAYKTDSLFTAGLLALKDKEVAMYKDFANNVQKSTVEAIKPIIEIYRQDEKKEKRKTGFLGVLIGVLGAIGIGLLIN